MRRQERQTGHTRSVKPTKMESVRAATRAPAQPGPFPWDPSLPGTKKPTARELRRGFGINYRQPKGA